MVLPYALPKLLVASNHAGRPEGWAALHLLATLGHLVVSCCKQGNIAVAPIVAGIVDTPTLSATHTSDAKDTHTSDKCKCQNIGRVGG